MFLVWSLNLTAGCSWAFMNDPWGIPVQKFHPSGIAACPVIVPSCQSLWVCSSWQTPFTPDREKIFCNAKWNSCCQQYLVFLCKWLCLSQKSLIWLSLSIAAKLLLISWVLTWNPVTWTAVQLFKIFSCDWSEWRAGRMTSCRFIG